MIRRIPAWPALALLVAGCGPDPAPPRTEPPAANPPQKGANLEDSCGRGNETFADHTWVPGDARVATSIRLDAADLDAALEHLERLARAEDHGLPITVAFSLSQLRLEVSLLREQLSAAGFVPHEVVRLSSPDGIPVWVVPTTCDLGEAKLRTGAAWKLDLRITASGVVGEPRPAEAGTVPFPHAVLFLPGDRMALVPADATAARAWMATRQPSADASAEPPGERLDAVGAAPIRMVFAGRALVAGNGDGALPGQLRATGDGVEIDGSLRAAP